MLNKKKNILKKKKKVWYLISVFCWRVNSSYIWELKGFQTRRTPARSLHTILESDVPVWSSVCFSFHVSGSVYPSLQDWGVNDIPSHAHGISSCTHRKAKGRKMLRYPQTLVLILCERTAVQRRDPDHIQQRHKTAEAGGHVWRAPLQPPSSEQGQLQQDAQGRGQPASPHLQGWRVCKLSGQPVPVRDHPHS